MKIENVLCPLCGTRILATIPLGQRIVCVSMDAQVPADLGATYKSASRCTSCKKSFVCYTSNG